ncbi:MAG: hypothetical protein K8J08_04790 [Thermoanaerobaculia bacterium]|nr:hypothetical protein [Thermoanaerobaculia bacterium]
MMAGILAAPCSPSTCSVVRDLDGGKDPTVEEVVVVRVGVSTDTGPVGGRFGVARAGVTRSGLTRWRSLD